MVMGLAILGFVYGNVCLMYRSEGKVNVQLSEVGFVLVCDCQRKDVLINWH
jgi:hypothetical protein